MLERPEDSSDLFDIMDVDDGMTEDDGRRFFTQILDATIQCEEQGILHRDIKPENIIIDLTNMDAKLTDFGLACETQEEPFRRFVGKSWKQKKTSPFTFQYILSGSSSGTIVTNDIN